MRHYELMVILDPELEERTVTKPRNILEDHQRLRWNSQQARLVGPSPYVF